MLVVAEMYGRLGPDGGGDQHVADLLKRTYTKLREADEAWRELRSSLGSSVYAMPLPQMTTLYNHWLSSLLWQVALVFTDGVVALAETQLHPGIYHIADTLCDDAAAQTRRTKTIKPVLAQLADMPHLPNNTMTYLGVWDACNEIINQVGDDLETITKLGVPSRMADIHVATVKVIQTQVSAANALRDDWESTTMAENRMQLTQELLTHTAEVFAAGQQLWAPYMVGQKFKEAVQKEKGFDELNLGFDPWILADPRRKVQADALKLKELMGFWESVTNRDAVPALVGEVDDARRSGKIRRRTDHGYTTAPWQSQFLVVRPVTLGGVAFQPGHLCAYYPARKGTEVNVEIRRAGTVRNIMELLGQS
jgi:hypothetical protein